MINLSSLLNNKSSPASGSGSNSPNNASKRPSSGRTSISIRDKLLLKEVQEMQDNLPRSASVTFPDANKLYTFRLTVQPTEGYWMGGRFSFSVDVPEAYNTMPPVVRCLTRLWHPNIDEDGKVCLSILRQSSIDTAGWVPTRRLKDVVWGVDALFGDLCDFNDALNPVAAEQHNRDEAAFRRKVNAYITDFAKR